MYFKNSILLFLFIFILSSFSYSYFLYQYPIDVVYVVDGDTCDADIYMGLGMVMKNQRIRLLGCDAWERNINRQKWEEAKSVAEDFLNTNTLILVTDGRRESFGRILGNIKNGNGKTLKETLEEKGLTTGRFEN
jgi:endonuclease YncB( thermonuclease family)